MELLYLLLCVQPPWWDVTWSTWGLFAVGLFGTGAAIWTLFLIRRQSKDTKTAADAALLNAQAVINSERAWVMVELDWVPGCPRIILGSSTYRESYTSARIRLKYTNEGRTITWIDDRLACFQIVKELPEKPDFGALQIISIEPEWLGSMGSGFLDVTLEAEGQEETEEDISIVWGIIRYHDAFGRHNTTFGFRIFSDYTFERIARLTEYNKTT